ncbi:MAG: glutathione S-transferase family protein [Burkholderiaceae bacterium]
MPSCPKAASRTDKQQTSVRCAISIGRAGDRRTESDASIARSVDSMKLYSAVPSPFCRKVRICAIELGLADRMEVVAQKPRDGTTGFHEVNPVARIPALVTDDGQVLYDSPVICEYLDSIGGGTLIPAAGAQRWDALRRQAMGDGLLDAAFPLRAELARDASQRDAEIVSRHRATMLRVLDAADRDPATDPGRTIDIGSIAVGAAISWLDFRMPDLGWRASRQRLSDWHAAISERPSFRTTQPS